MVDRAVGSKPRQCESSDRRLMSLDSLLDIIELIERI
jgi:hypothetical protein